MSTTNPIRVVIRASVWDRGHTDKLTCLKADRGMCCLGFDALACGVPEDVIAGKKTPTVVKLEHPGRFPEYIDPWVERDGISSTATGRALRAMRINDDPGLTDDERIEELRPIFREAGRILVWRPDL